MATSTMPELQQQLEALQSTLRNRRTPLMVASISKGSQTLTNPLLHPPPTTSASLHQRSMTTIKVLVDRKKNNLCRFTHNQHDIVSTHYDAEAGELTFDESIRFTPPLGRHHPYSHHSVLTNHYCYSDQRGDSSIDPKDDELNGRHGLRHPQTVSGEA